MKVGRYRGFTLIEVLVAVAVFGMLAVLAYMALGQTLANAEMLTTRMTRLHNIQRAMIQLSNDLLQASPRPVRNALGDGYEAALHTALDADFALELTHGGWPNPAGVPRSTQQRSAYRIEDGQLVRYHWNVLDRTYANEPVVRVLLDDVDSLVLRYLQVNGEWTEVWPPQNAGGGGLSSRPRAVEIVLTLQDAGEIRRIIEVAP
jgi:general secretion pathway protein J